MKILHTTPAQDGFYMPAEFAPHEGLPDDLAGTRRQLAITAPMRPGKPFCV